jgi:signal transduction histidine kinase
MGALSIGYCQRTAEVAVDRQNLLHKVFDALPIGIWVRARDGRSLFVNERWASFSPWSVEQILTRGSREPPVDLGQEWASNIPEVLSSENSAVRYQSIELADTSDHKLSLTLLTLRMLIDQENDFGTLSLLVDETALRLYEEKIRQSEQNLHVALNNARMGFWNEDIKTQQIICDENWYHLIGAKHVLEESPLTIWEERLHPDDRKRVHKLYEEYYRKGEGSLRVEYRIRKGSQNYIWVEDCAQITECAVDGTSLRATGTMQDITDLKQAEFELKQAIEHAEMGNQAKSQFIATISHEIRTPLNAIIGLSSFLTEGELESEKMDLARTISSSAKGLLLLVNDILDFSKVEAGRLELEIQEYPLLLCFEECVKLFKTGASEKGVALSLDLSTDLPEFAVGDMERLRQIVQNLLANALKFTDTGEVTLSVRPVMLSDIDESRRPDPLEPIGYLDQLNHDYLEVSIQDTGIGVPKDQQHVLFEAFSQVDASTTRKYGGTGLGLVICKRLVNAMGGRIWVESVEEQGSIFSFVVRTKLIVEDSETKLSSGKYFDSVERIAEAHPCDILVVGAEEKTHALVAVCRQLGYAPHWTEDYSLSSSAYRRRHYSIIFVCLGEDQKAMQVARKFSETTLMLKPRLIVGCSAPGQTVSKESCRLAGIHEVLADASQPNVVGEAIFRALDVHD